MITAQLKQFNSFQEETYLDLLLAAFQLIQTCNNLINKLVDIFQNDSTTYSDKFSFY